MCAYLNTPNTLWIRFCNRPYSNSLERDGERRRERERERGREGGREREREIRFFVQMYLEEGLTIVSPRASNCSIFHPQPNCHNSTTSCHASCHNDILYLTCMARFSGRKVEQSSLENRNWGLKRFFRALTLTTLLPLAPIRN